MGIHNSCEHSEQWIVEDGMIWWWFICLFALTLVQMVCRRVGLDEATRVVLGDDRSGHCGFPTFQILVVVKFDQTVSYMSRASYICNDLVD